MVRAPFCLRSLAPSTGSSAECEGHADNQPRVLRDLLCNEIAASALIFVTYTCTSFHRLGTAEKAIQLDQTQLSYRSNRAAALIGLERYREARV